MWKKMLALLTVFCLLAGCGAGSQVAQQAAEQNAAASAADSTPEASTAPAESALEEAPTALEGAPEDPAELGKWLLEQTKTYYAVDYDMDTSVLITVAGEESTVNLSTRQKQIEHEDGSLTVQQEEQLLGTITKTWFDDGMVYFSDASGNYKAPLDLEAFMAQFLGSAEETLDLGTDSFDGLTAEQTDSGYTVTYQGIAPELISTVFGMVENLLGDIGLSDNPPDLSMEGAIFFDPDGYMLRHEIHMTMTADLLGETLTEEIDAVQVINNINEKVSIAVPADDETFMEMSDINIPTVFYTGYDTTLAQDAITYQDTMALTITDGSATDTYIQQDDISYRMDFSGLSVVWNSNTSCNGETIDWLTDTYACGEGTLEDSAGVEPYTYDDESFSLDIVDFVLYYTDSFDYGSNFLMETEGSLTKLTYDVAPEYVETVLDGFSESLATGVSFADASSIVSSGTMTAWFDSATGLMVSQRFQGTSDLTLETGVITVSLEDSGDITALGSDVVLTGNGY